MGWSVDQPRAVAFSPVACSSSLFTCGRLTALAWAGGEQLAFADRDDDGALGVAEQ